MPLITVTSTVVYTVPNRLYEDMLRDSTEEEILSNYKAAYESVISSLTEQETSLLQLIKVDVTKG